MRLVRRPAGLRDRLLLVMVLATAVFLGAATAGFNLILATRLDGAANDVLRSRIRAEMAEGHLSGGRLIVPPTSDQATVVDQPVWIFVGRRVLEQPRGSRVLDAAARRLAGGPRRIVDLPDGSNRLLAVPIRDDNGRRLGTIVSSVSLAPYRRTLDIALVTSIALAVALLGASVIATRWALAAGLRPVAQMTAQAAEWSEHDLDRRFALGPPHDELTQLAATLDGLLGRLAAGLRREQRFSAELSHELRTPLARMHAQAQLALAGDLPDEQREAWASVLRSSGDMGETLDALLAGARGDASQRGGVADAAHAAAAVAERFAPLAAERGVRIGVTGTEETLRAGVDAELLERLLQPLVDNACRYAASEVTIAVGSENGYVVYAITDDGPGVRDDERERIFEPAVRGSAGTAVRQGTGLGLALARRLARAAGGTVDADARPDGGGGCFLARVPAA
jgi:signal transduction histidine kinase